MCDMLAANYYLCSTSVYIINLVLFMLYLYIVFYFSKICSNCCAMSKLCLKIKFKTCNIK